MFLLWYSIMYKVPACMKFDAYMLVGSCVVLVKCVLDQNQPCASVCWIRTNHVQVCAGSAPTMYKCVLDQNQPCTSVCWISTNHVYVYAGSEQTMHKCVLDQNQPCTSVCWIRTNHVQVCAGLSTFIEIIQRDKLWPKIFE